MNLDELKEEILVRISRFGRAQVTRHVLREFLYDPQEDEYISPKFPVSHNEAVMLAGGRRRQSTQEIFEEWLTTNNIKWIDSLAEDSRLFWKDDAKVMEES